MLDVSPCIAESTHKIRLKKLGTSEKGLDKKDVERALRLVEKYSLIWQSTSSEVVLEPEVIIQG